MDKRLMPSARPGGVLGEGFAWNSLAERLLRAWRFALGGIRGIDGGGPLPGVPGCVKHRDRLCLSKVFRAGRSKIPEVGELADEAGRGECSGRLDLIGLGLFE